MSGRLFLLLGVLCAASIATINGVPIAGNTESNRHLQLQHLKDQLDEFKKELDAVLVESSGPEEEAVAPVADAEEDKRCDCDETSPLQKRCPNECTKKKPKPAPAAEEVKAEKRCEGCVPDGEAAGDPEKRCPTGCTSRSKQAKQHSAAAVQDSPVMKRFLSVIPAKDHDLVERAGSKKQFIDRIFRRSHAKREDDPDRVAAPAVSNTAEQPLPAEENSVMATFKRNLNPEQQELLKKHSSKSEVIKRFLERSEVHKRTLSEQQVHDTINKLESPSDKALVQKHISKIEYVAEAMKKPAGQEEQVAKRKLSQSQVQDVLNKLKNPDDKALVEKHLSKIEYLAEAEKKPDERKEEVAKRKLSESQVQDVLNKLKNPDDRALVQNHLSKIEQVAEVEKGPAERKEEIAEVVSNLVKDIKLAKKGGVNLERLISALKKRAEDAKKPASLKQ